MPYSKHVFHVLHTNLLSLLDALTACLESHAVFSVLFMVLQIQHALLFSDLVLAGGVENAAIV